ncbi:hypothetical protein [Rhodococcus artemisiae]|uniref:Uncharacterized protein n=1 Tax=Rhodococcus artemisiae TaxID=714159 RepID=A0ABU7L9N8_9NOCA|nr:hypothetical protein [Rhodococcus artemisiae]MEE2058275.1 hypothetical protein [Rhodococcus artemisiae]
MNDDLNEFATRIGYTVNQKDGVWLISRGRPGSQKLVESFLDSESVREWLEERARSAVWNLDMEDPAVTVRNPNGSGVAITVEITDAENPDAGAVMVDGGVGSDFPSGEISSFFVRTEEPPAIGFWYR